MDGVFYLNFVEAGFVIFAFVVGADMVTLLFVIAINVVFVPVVAGVDMDIM